MRLLLVEDDRTFGQALADFLRGAGHVVDWVQAIGPTRALAHEPFDAILLDWQLPDGSGLDWLRALRRAGNSVPVLMLTARDARADRIGALDAGADDYLIKPIDPEELVARVRAVCRRQAQADSSAIAVGDVRLDLARRQVLRDGQAVVLTAREWQVAEALLLRRGRWVDKSTLESLLSGLDGDVSANTIEVYIYLLRRKLGRPFVQTARGLGYRIEAAG